MKTTRPKPRTVRTIEKLLFRRPTGLADGLALKELAPQVAQDLTRPTQLGPPLPGHDSGHSALWRGTVYPRAAVCPTRDRPLSERSCETSAISANCRRLRSPT